MAGSHLPDLASPSFQHPIWRQRPVPLPMSADPKPGHVGPVRQHLASNDTATNFIAGPIAVQINEPSGNGMNKNGLRFYLAQWLQDAVVDHLRDIIANGRGNRHALDTETEFNVSLLSAFRKIRR